MCFLLCTENALHMLSKKTGIVSKHCTVYGGSLIAPAYRITSLNMSICMAICFQDSRCQCSELFPSNAPLWQMRC